MNSKDLQIQETAKRQHGAISWLQLKPLGVTRQQIMRRVQASEWVRELPGVWRLTWAEPSWMQRVWCAALWGGSDGFISHGAAACLWNLEGLRIDYVDLSSPRQLRTRVDWVVPHRTVPLARSMRRIRNGLALTSPSRTLIDLAGVVDRDTLEKMLEQAFRRRIVSVRELQRVLSLLPERGKAGTGTITRVLEAALWDTGTQSELERRALHLFRRFGLPTPECQYNVLHDNHRLATVDFAWPRAKVIVEAEGFQFHSGREHWERDIARYNELVLQGWTILRLTYEQLERESSAFMRAISAAIRHGEAGGTTRRLRH